MPAAARRVGYGLVRRLVIGVTVALLSEVTAVAAGECGLPLREPSMGPVEKLSSTPQDVRRRHHVMGTWLDITVRAATRAKALDAAEAAVRAVEATDARLSTWRTDTELARINARGPVSILELSPQMARDLDTALHWWRETAGAFNPGIGTLVSAWDLRGEGRVPSDHELNIAVAKATLSGTHISGHTLTVGAPGLRFEEGGFGKGSALRDALQSAVDSGASCTVLDFGGQVAVSGHCGATSIGIADPDNRGREVVILDLANGSAATSGLSERSVVIHGTPYGHIIDPRSGLPQDPWGSVTVVAADPMTADILATALYVMGPARGAEWLSEHRAAEAVFAVRREGELKLTATPGLRGRLHGLESKIQYLPPPHRRTETDRN